MAASMRILVVSQYFWPENFRINDLVGELAQRGHQVTVLTGLPNYPDGKLFSEYATDPERYSHYEGADVIRVPMLPRGRGGVRLLLNYFTFAVSASLVGIWRLRGRKFDAVFTYQLSPVTVGVPAVLMRSIKCAPMIFWVQDLWPETLQAVGAIQSPFGIWAVGRLVAFIYRRCDLILAQSRSFIPQIRKYAPLESRVLYFPNWSDPVTDMMSSPPAVEVPVRPGSFNVMFAGNIGEAQDFPAILAAAERLKAEQPKIRWLIVGDGRMAGWVAEEVKRRQLQEQVLLLGRFPPERMSSFFKHADALLVSLKDEPIFSMTVPSKLQTYLAAGIPVLAMLNGEGADVVRGSGSGITSRAGDHEALASAVLRLSQITVQARRAMGRKGLMVSEREFDRDNLITRLEGWFEQLRFYDSKSSVTGSNS